MSTPDPKNPYGPPPVPGGPPPGQAPYGAPHDPYGAPPPAYGQQPYGHQPYGPPGYGYPHPHGPAAPQGMPGLVIAARVLLFVAGGLWVIGALFMLLFAFAADSIATEDLNGLEDAAVGVGIVLFLLFGGLAALHIVPAALFGRGGTATRVTAIVAASVNTLVALLGIVGWLSGSGQPGSGGPGGGVLNLLWLTTAVLTLVFCSGPQAGQWFRRPRP